MKKTIVVPTDFSSNALTATQNAIKLSEKMGLNLHILHAYMAFHSAFQSELANQTDEKRAALGAQKGMQSFLQSLGQLAEQPHVSSSEVKAGLVEAVTRFTGDENTELIVMGTHGASGLKMGLLGSNTYDIAKAAVAPLLIIPANTMTDLGNVVFFTDYQDGDRETWKGLISLFGRFIKQCTLVHIHQEKEPPTAADQEKLDQWKVQLEGVVGLNGLLTTELVQGKESVDIVNQTVDKLQATLTILTLVGGRNFFEKLTHKSLAKAIIHQPKTPVLLIGSD